MPYNTTFFTQIYFIVYSRDDYTFGGENAFIVLGVDVKIMTKIVGGFSILQENVT